MPFIPPAPPGAGGDTFACNEHVGELVVIDVLEAKEGVSTKNGTANAISANVTVIKGAEPGRRFVDALVFGSVVFNQLKGLVGQRTLVRIGQGVPTGSNTPPWIVDPNVTAEEVAQAEAMLVQQSMATPAPAVPPAAQAYQPPPAPGYPAPVGPPAAAAQPQRY